MTKSEARTVNLIFSATVSLVLFVVGITLMLAYFDVLVK